MSKIRYFFFVFLAHFQNSFLLFLGDDARKVRWIQLDRKYNLYASHESIIQIIIKQHRAYEYWQDNKYLNKSIIDKDTN